MLFLTFRLGTQAYALQARNVREVLPMLSVQPLPEAPRGVVGVFDYHGRSVPALDLALLTLGRPAAERLGTRIILVTCRSGQRTQPLGLIAEQVVDLIRKDPVDLEAAAVTLKTAAYLGPVMFHGKDSVQLIVEQNLLPEAVRERLFMDQRIPLADRDCSGT